MIEGDLYYIEGRIREIDPDYFLVRKGPAVEVHHRKQVGSTRVLTVPYPTLDARTLQLVRRTRAERAAAYLAELERENETLERDRLHAAVEKAAAETERRLSAV